MIKELLKKKSYVPEPLNLPVVDCRCGTEKYLPSKNIDRCPKCLLKKYHPHK